MAELISLAVPAESDKTLLVWELNSGPTAEALHVSRARMEGGMGIFSLALAPRPPLARPGFYAIIKFYSAKNAYRAQKACDQKQLFQNSPVKV
ncbi:RDM1 protein, partial [Crocuta crocuta]